MEQQRRLSEEIWWMIPIVNADSMSTDLQKEYEGMVILFQWLVWHKKLPHLETQEITSSRDTINDLI
jgi:hypothetical protein